MSDLVKISELSSVEDLNTSDMLEISQPRLGGILSNKMSLGQLGEALGVNTQLGFFYQANAYDIPISTSNMMINKLSFSLNRDTDVDNWTETTINTTFDQGSTQIVAYISYRLNGTEMSRTPIETWKSDGYHTLNLGYHIPSLVAETQYRWEVYIRLEGGTGVVERNSSVTVLTVIGFSEEQRWDGTIGMELEVGKFSDQQTIKSFTVSQPNVDVDILSVREHYYEDNIPYFSETQTFQGIQDSGLVTPSVWTLDYVLRGCNGNSAAEGAYDAGDDLYDNENEITDGATCITCGLF